MADIQTYLNNILNAIYGEEVRDSIHDAIDIINKVGEVTLTLGTAVTSTSSSTTGYYKNSVYLNTNTWDVWRCSGTAWAKMGNIKGASPKSMEKTGTKANTNGLVDIYTVTSETGQSLGTIEITNANQLTASELGAMIRLIIANSDGTKVTKDIPAASKIGIGTAVTSTNTSTTIDGVTYYNNDIYLNSSTSDLWRCVGAAAKSSAGIGWTKIGNFKGDKGDKGDQGIQGYSITDISKTSQSGLVDTYTIRNSAGTAIGTFTVTNGERGPQGYHVNSISKTSTEGLVDTYTMRNNNDDTVGSFTVTNGAKGDKGDQGIQGEKGDQGIQGVPGPQGFSPLVSTSKSGKVTTITISDIDGPHYVELRDGSDGDGSGDMLKSTYDTDDDGIVDHAKVADTLTTGSDFVSKNGDTMLGSLTIGTNTITSGNYSESVGTNNTVNGNYSLAVGNTNVAQGTGSAALGIGVRATADGQIAIGKYNDYLNDSYHTDAILEVGIGTSNVNRLNGMQLLKSGDLYVSGDIYSNDTKVSGAVTLVGTFDKSISDYTSSMTYCKENISGIQYDANNYYYIQVLSKTDSLIYGMLIEPENVIRVNANTVQIQYYQIRSSAVGSTEALNGTYKLGIFCAPKN